MKIYKIFFGGEFPGNAGVNTGLLLLRVFAGLALALAHGWLKFPPSEGFIAGVAKMGFPLPLFFAWAAVLSEFIGGLLLAVGLFTRPASLFILLTMLTAAFIRNAGNPFAKKELALLYGFIALFLLIAGAGRYSVDYLMRKNADRAKGLYK
ncbi:MAG: DoxX family protein [Calditrichia bacterium]